MKHRYSTIAIAAGAMLFLSACDQSAATPDGEEALSPEAPSNDPSFIEDMPPPVSVDEPTGPATMMPGDGDPTADAPVTSMESMTDGARIGSDRETATEPETMEQSDQEM